MTALPRIIDTVKSKIPKQRTFCADTEKAELLAALSDAKAELDIASENINFVSDPMLVDYFIFKAKAVQIRYRYLLNRARKMGIESKEYTEKMLENKYCKNRRN